MKKREFEIYLQKLHPELFGFAKAMRPLCVDAKELVFETLWLIFTQRREVLEDFSKNADLTVSESSVGRAIYSFKISFLKEMYHLFCSQFQSPKGELEDRELEGVDSPFLPFYRLSGEQRMTLYIRSKTSMTWDDMAFIFDRPRYELMITVMLAREALAKKMGLSFEPKNRPKEKEASDLWGESKAGDSFYLYHKDCRELYLNSFSSQNECRFSKNIYPLMDGDEQEEEDYIQFKKHLEKCSICQNELSFIKNTFQQIDKKVPLARVQRSIQMDFEERLKDFLHEHSLPHKVHRFFRPLLKGMRFLSSN